MKSERGATCQKYERRVYERLDQFQERKMKQRSVMRKGCRRDMGMVDVGKEW